MSEVMSTEAPPVAQHPQPQQRKHAGMTFGTMKMPWVMPLWEKLEAMGFEVTETDKEKAVKRLIPHWEIRYRSIGNRDEMVKRLMERFSVTRNDFDQVDTDMLVITWMNQFITNFNHERHAPRRKEYLQYILKMLFQLRSVVETLDTLVLSSSDTTDAVHAQHRLLTHILQTFDVYVDLTRRKLYNSIQTLLATPEMNRSKRTEMYKEIKDMFNVLPKNDPHHQFLFFKFREAKTM
jgi:hypothetical protein